MLSFFSILNTRVSLILRFDVQRVSDIQTSTYDIAITKEGGMGERDVGAKTGPGYRSWWIYR